MQPATACARFLLGFVLVLGDVAFAHPNNADELSVSDVKQMIDRNEAVYLYDANDRQSYLDGHVPGAIWVSYDAVGTADLPAAKDAKLVFYCYNPMCGASHLAAKRARELGYRNVLRMPEGIVGWRDAKMPVVSGPNPR